MDGRMLRAALALSWPLALVACGGGGEGGEPAQPGAGSTHGQTSTLLPLTQLAGSRDPISAHVLAVPAGALTLEVSTSGGTGNVDIAVLGPRARECESASSGND